MADLQLDISQLVKDDRPKYAISLSSESEADAAARRHETSEKAKHGRRVHFWIVMLMVVVVLGSFFWLIILATTGSPEEKRFASSIVLVMVSSVSSGLVGHAIKKAD